MPESLTRREFIKELGKLGAAASLAPMVFAGEQMSDKSVGVQRPGFIKQVDQPTTEVDWAQVERIAEGERTARRSFTKYIGQLSPIPTYIAVPLTSISNSMSLSK